MSSLPRFEESVEAFQRHEQSLGARFQLGTAETEFGFDPGCA
jgi:hypothetical protein